MKKIITLISLALTVNLSLGQIVGSFNHPSGYTMNTTCSRLVHDGYLVAGTYNTGAGPVHHITRYSDNGLLTWTKTESTYTLAGMADMAEDGQHNLYFLFSSAINNHYYHLLKADSAGNVLYSINLNQASDSAAAAPRLYINTANEIFVVSATPEATAVFKLESSGNMMWSKVILMDTSANTPVFTGCTLADGGLMLAGRAENDLYFQRLDVSGDVQWTKRIFDGGLSTAEPGTMMELQDGNFLVAGSRTENTGSLHEGLFVLKFDTTGMVLDHKFYFDNMGEHTFKPHTMAENATGDIKISGKGDEITFVDLDAALVLMRYTEWTGAGEVESTPNCFDSSPAWFLATATGHDTIQYVMTNSLDGGDFCSENEIYSIVEESLAFDNLLYTVWPYEMSKGPETWFIADDLQPAAGFAQTNVCGLDGVSSESASSTDVIFHASPNPVPVAHEISISTSGFLSYVTFTNIEGKVIKRQSLSGQEDRVLMGDMPTGIYLMNVFVDNKPAKTSRIVVY